MQYHYPFSEASTLNKYGVNITSYKTDIAEANVVYEETTVGHLEEFYNEVSTYIWFIIEGEGTFVINNERIAVKAKDQIVLPPKSRVHYFGNLKMVLVSTPAYTEDDARHVRDIPVEESPYK